MTVAIVPLYICTVCYVVYIASSSGFPTGLLLLPSLYTEAQHLSDLPKVTHPTGDRTRCRPSYVTPCSFH